MCGTCCTCAATFTFDGPRVLGSSCLATAADWTVTKLKTSKKRQEKTRSLTDTPSPVPQVFTSGTGGTLSWVKAISLKQYLCSGSYSGQQKSSALRLFQSDQPVMQKTWISFTNIPWRSRSKEERSPQATSSKEAVTYIFSHDPKGPEELTLGLKRRFYLSPVRCLKENESLWVSSFNFVI